MILIIKITPDELNISITLGMSTNSEIDTEKDGAQDARKGAKVDQFSGTISMFVTLLAYSLGMSDIWRFPFLVYRNGGGAFLIPFVITIVLCGIPIYFLEFSIANFSGKGPFQIWDISPIFRGVGLAIPFGYFTWMIGSSVFRSWLAVFLVDSLKDPLPWTRCDNSWNTPTCKDNPFTSVTNSTTFPKQFTNSSTTSYNVSTAVNNSFRMTAAEEYWQFEALGLSSGITDFTPILWRHILFMLVLRVIVFLSLIKSIKSIEKVMYVLVIVRLLFLLVIMIQSLTLPGTADGLYEFFYPDFDKLKSIRIWVEAFLMAFYTLAFGWGGIITMGTHAHFKDNCVRTAIILPILDSFIAILHGAGCFMVLGNMAHAYGIKLYDVFNAGFSAGVVSYVSALSILPAPQFWNFTFIIVAIISGLDSQIVPMEMCTRVVGEIFPHLYPKYRLHVLTALSVLLFIMALPTCTGAGAYIFLWIDWYTGGWVGPIVAFIELVVVGWIYGMDRFSVDVSLMTGKPIPRFFRICVVFLSPIIVFGILVTACVEYVPPKYGSYLYPSWARGVGWLIIACILSPIIVKAVLVVRQQSGTLRNRINRSSRATSNWGPKDRQAEKEFSSQRTLCENRTIKDMLYYVIFGSYRDESNSATKRELAVLVDK